jgi:hypothetical protein
MLGGETGEITFGKSSINLGLRAERISSWYNTVYWHIADCKGVVVKFMTVFGGLPLAKGCDRIAALTPCKQKSPLKLSAYINRTAVFALSGKWPLGSERILG